MGDSWLTSDGKIIKVGKNGHNEYASDLLEEEMGFDELYSYMDRNNISYPYEVLHQKGWVRVKYNDNYLPKITISGGCIDLTKPMKNTMDPAMNGVQIRIAKELCEKCDTSLHIAINDKRFW